MGDRLGRSNMLFTLQVSNYVRTYPNWLLKTGQFILYFSSVPCKYGQTPCWVYLMQQMNKYKTATHTHTHTATRKKFNQQNPMCKIRGDRTETRTTLNALIAVIRSKTEHVHGRSAIPT
jgi:hypothetical protein